MRVYGLLGFPLSHSFSKSFFTERFKEEEISDCIYENFSFEKIEDAVLFLRANKNLKGFNITIPHKVGILKYLDKISPACTEIQSCNCVRIENEKWEGFNTDVTGFTNSISPLLQPFHKNALIFGTGGASKAVEYSLKQLGIAYQMVSRTTTHGYLTYSDLSQDIINSHHLLINTTPLGMYPNVNECLPIPYQYITPKHLAYDLTYNPEETLFLKKAREKGAATKNGREMLIIQAEESWKIWDL